MSDKCNTTNREGCEIQIYDTITKFNDDFTNYQHAYNKCYSPDGTRTCRINSIKDKKVTEIWNLINDDISNLNTYINEYKDNFSKNDKLSNGTSSPAGSPEFYTDILNQYNIIVQKRQKMDMQLYELYTNDHDSMYSINPMVESSILTGIIWTILATSIIYYVVIKL